MPGGNCAKKDPHLLLEDYFTKKEQLERITAVLQEELLKVPNAKKLLAVKGIGIITVAGFLAEVGDLGRFTSPKQIQKLAGLEPKETAQTAVSGRSSTNSQQRGFPGSVHLLHDSKRQPAKGNAGSDCRGL